MIESLKGRRLVASVSGGKDSTAMALHLIELGLDFEAVFLDTGWEHPATVEYATQVLPDVLGRPVKVLRADSMVDLIRRKDMFPGRLHRFCTEQLKVVPMHQYLAGLDDPVNAIGIRADESARRSTMPEWEESSAVNALIWRPILRWTVDDVIAIHHRHGVVPNPLYLQGASRVGCFPCIYARKSEVRLVSELWPERIDEIAALEDELTASARAKAIARSQKPWPSALPTKEDAARVLGTAKAVAGDNPAARRLLSRVRNIARQKTWSIKTRVERIGNLLRDKAHVEAAGVLVDIAVKLDQMGLFLEEHAQEAMVPDADSAAAALARLGLSALAEAEGAWRDPFHRNQNRTFFGPGEKGRSWDDYGIRSIVEWARTGQGGRQFELFDSRPTDEGCMRWGLCEHPSADRALVQIDGTGEDE